MLHFANAGVYMILCDKCGDESYQFNLVKLIK